MVHTRRYIAYLLAFGVLISLVSLDVQAQTGNCAPALADAYLKANNVRARILNNGSLFWRGSPFVYEVPRGSGKNSLFTASLWVGGLVENELRIAAARYGPDEFWPGPLDDNGNPPDDCAPYDRVYRVTAADLAALDERGFVSPRVREWPWQLGAPVVDGDGDPDNYNLAGGDRPELVGASMLWWVMNDRGNTHNATGSEPVGLEVQATAFAGSGEGDLDNTTFYRYKLLYKGTEPLRDAYVSFFVDVDLGNFDDDYIGSDSTKGIGYVYNSDDFDEGGEGYGAAPPALGVAFLHGPLAESDGLDNDRDGMVDEAGERLQMTSFNYFNGGGCVTCDPGDGLEYYNYMRGRWRDGQPFTFGGNARDFSDTPTTFVFTGNPVLKEFWTEFNRDGEGTAIAPADRRFLTSMGPFDMEPGAEEEIGIGIVWARGADHLDSVTELLASPVFEAPFPRAAFGSPPPGTPPAEAARLAAPGDGASSQPTNTTLHWQPVAAATDYYLQWATEPVFDRYDAGDMEVISRVTTLEVEEAMFLGDFAADTRYYWRVLPFSAAGPGATWSPVYTFTTSDVEHDLEGVGFADFTVVSNANGPLDPPVGAGADWQGFPGTGRPNFDQQVGDGRWFIHTVDEGASPAYEDFVRRAILEAGGWKNVAPYDYEWRFTERCLAAYTANAAEPGCLAWNAYTLPFTVIPVPFELWRIGINTPDDPSDDVRMIPYVSDAEDDGWGLRDVDHSASGLDDDPQTDGVTWRLPADLTPGEGGYAAWEAAALALPVGAGGFPEAASQDAFFGVESPAEAMGRVVLVNWSGGDVARGVYDQELPEPRTIFRITTRDLVTPLLSAPRNGATDSPPALTLWWHGAVTDVQVARDSAFTELVFEAEPPGSSVAVTGLVDGATYYWRTGNIGRWSATWRFTVDADPNSTEPEQVPTDFRLDQNYPNPFNPVTTFRFGLPQAGTATLAVYNLLGQRVAVVADDAFAAGWHTVSWDASDLASGVYVYRLQAGAHQTTRRMVLLK